MSLLGEPPVLSSRYASKRKASTKAVRRPSNSAFLQSYELALGTDQCHQPKLQPCPRQTPRSSQPPWPSGDDQASAAQSGGL
ncbi:hypothetical protein FA425_28585, partial [Pseudomonas aeruginosa]|nr:hypothetical protein [Pseudomonas aeruginosa]